MAVKNGKGALWALAAAGGMLAWRNKDKIQGWVQSQRSTLQNNMSNQAANTGETRRIQPEYQSSTGTTEDPFRTEI